MADHRNRPVRREFVDPPGNLAQGDMQTVRQLANVKFPGFTNVQNRVEPACLTPGRQNVGRNLQRQRGGIAVTVAPAAQKAKS
jgi:hypothetical protein